MTPERRRAFLVALVLVGVACSERLTPSRAATIIRHSKAFLSGSPESQPVFDGVSSLLAGSGGSTPERQEGDLSVAEFRYHWPAKDPASSRGPAGLTLTASVVLRRSPNGWAVDDERSKTLTPSWPQLPRTPNPFATGTEVRQ